MYSLFQLNSIMQFLADDVKGKVVKVSYENGIIELIIKNRHETYKKYLYGKDFINILNKVSPSGYKQFKNGKQFSLHYYNLLKLHLLEKQYKVNFADYETFSVNKGSALLKKSNNENDLLIMDRDDYKMYKKVYKR